MKEKINKASAILVNLNIISLFLKIKIVHRFLLFVFLNCFIIFQCLAKDTLYSALSLETDASWDRLEKTFMEGTPESEKEIENLIGNLETDVRYHRSGPFSFFIEKLSEKLQSGDVNVIESILKHIDYDSDCWNDIVSIFNINARNEKVKSVVLNLTKRAIESKSTMRIYQLADFVTPISKESFDYIFSREIENQIPEKALKSLRKNVVKNSINNDRLLFYLKDLIESNNTLIKQLTMDSLDEFLQQKSPEAKRILDTILSKSLSLQISFLNFYQESINYQHINNALSKALRTNLYESLLKKLIENLDFNEKIVTVLQDIFNPMTITMRNELFRSFIKKALDKNYDINKLSMLLTPWISAEGDTVSLLNLLREKKELKKLITVALNNYSLYFDSSSTSKELIAENRLDNIVKILNSLSTSDALLLIDNLDSGSDLYHFIKLYIAENYDSENMQHLIKELSSKNKYKKLLKDITEQRMATCPIGHLIINTEKLLPN